MNSSDERTDAESSEFWVPVTWSAAVDTSVSRRAMETFVCLVLELPDVFDLTVRLAAGGGQQTEAGLVVRGADAAHALAMVRRLSAAASAVMPFIGFGEAVAVAGWNRLVPSFHLEPVEGSGRSVVHTHSPPWVAAAGLSDRTQMDLALLRLTPDAGGAEPTVRCSVEISGQPGDASLVAALVAADAVGDVRLEARPGAGRPIDLPLPMVGHLAATPCRVPGVWPSQRVPPLGVLCKAFENSVPPHGVVFGGTGQGKTTLIEHRIAAAVEMGRQVFVVCPTGDLAARAASVLAEAGAPFDAVDFADEQYPAAFNLCEAPSWVRPDDHIADVIDSIEQSWLGELKPEMLGPVGRRSLRAGLAPLVCDPYGPWPITCLPELLSAGALPTDWAEVIERIDDPSVTALLTETRRAISNDRESHLGAWLLSKIEPFIAAGRIRRVVDHSSGVVRLERLINGRSLVVSIPGSALGDRGATVLIGVLVAQFWHLVRTQPLGSCAAIDLIMDEAQRVPSPLLRTLLAEIRKYGVRMLLATQTVTAFDPQTLASVLANCGAIGTFRVGPHDAAVLGAKYPTVAAGQLQRLPRHWMALSLGDRDLVGPTDPPLVDSSDQTTLQVAHRLGLAEYVGDGTRAASR